MKSNTKKRLIAFMLCMVLVLSSATSAFADEPQNTDSQSQTEAVAEPAADEATGDEAAVNSSEQQQQEEQQPEQQQQQEQQQPEQQQQEQQQPEQQQPETEAPTVEAPAEQPAAEEAQPIQQLTYENDNVKITVDAVESGNIPEGATLSVTPIIKQEITDSMSDEEKTKAEELNNQYDFTENKLKEKAEDESYDIAGFLAYNITFVDADGNKMEPNGNVKVTMDYKQPVIAEDAVQTVNDTEWLNSTKDLDVTVLHLEEDNKGKVTDVVDMTAEDTNGDAEINTTSENEIQKVTITTNSFSTFAITYSNYSVTVKYVDQTGAEITSNQFTQNNVSIKKDKDIKISDKVKIPETVTIDNKTYQYSGAHLDGVSGENIYSIKVNEDGEWKYKVKSGDKNKDWNDGEGGTIYLVYQEQTQEQPTALPTVGTIDSTSKGITMRMINYSKPAAGLSDKIGGPYTVDGVSGCIKQNLLNRVLTEGYPVTVGGTSLKTLFTGGTNVNHLFLQSSFNADGSYEYSSFKNYAHLEKNGDFTVYDALGTPSEYDRPYFQRGNFMPYNSISASDVSTNKNLYDESGNKLSSSDPAHGKTLYKTQGNPDYYFGMYVEADFNQPRNGKLTNESDMVYEFNGDDDLWVYVDGVLMLDIGGIHDAHSGSINFATGDITYDSASPTTIKAQFQAAGVFPDGSPWDDSKVSEFFNGNTLKDFTAHNFKMFYMERGAGASNLKMKFNLEVIPTYEVNFNKVDTQGSALPGAEFEIRDDSDSSRVYNVTSGSDGGVSVRLHEGTYTMTETQAPTGYLAASGTWKIKVNTDGTYTIKKNGEEIAKDSNNVYKIVNKGQHEDAEANLTTSKTVKVTDYKKREYEITLGASTSGREAGTEAEAASVVLVLDRSGSMGTDGMTALVNAADTFIDTLKTASPDSQVAVVYFNGTQGSDSNTTQSQNFTKLNTDQNVESIKNFLSTNGYSYGGTPMGDALKKAKGLLDADQTGNQKYVLFFTDGLPGHNSDDAFNCMVANSAVNYATDIKEKATIYTVGYNLSGTLYWHRGDSATSSDGRDHGYYYNYWGGGYKNHDLSTSASDFLKNYIATTAPEGSNSKYAYTVDKTADLGKEFKKLAAQIGAYYSINAEKIVDVIDARFELTEAGRKALVGDVKATTNEDGSKTYVKKETGKDGAVVGTVKITENTDGTTTIEWTGTEAHIGNKDNQEDPAWERKIGVVAKADFIGGNAVTTNTGDSGVFVNENTTKMFPKPTVNVKALSLEMTGKEITVYKGDALQPQAYYNQLAQTIKVVELDGATKILTGVKPVNKNKTQVSLPALTDAQKDELENKKTLTIGDGDNPEYKYIYPGTSDAVGYFKYIYTIPATPGGSINNHTAGNAASPAEKYNLEVVFVPYTVEQRMAQNSGITAPAPDGGTIVSENSENLTASADYIVNIIDGSIEITKVLETEPKGENGDTFTFTVTGPNNFSKEVQLTVTKNPVDGKYTATYNGDELKHLARGEYTVTEKVAAGYDVKSIKNDATATNTKYVLNNPEDIHFTMGTVVENGKDVNVIKNYTYNPEDGGTLGKAIFTNEPVYSDWQIIKVSASSHDVKLAGAIFELQSTTDKNVKYYGKSGDAGIVKWYQKYQNNDVSDEMTGKLPTGTYTLKEIKAPTGYTLSSNTYTLQITKTGALKTIQLNGENVAPALQDGKYQILIENTPLYDLPSAGGNGIYLYMIGGILLMFAAAWILYKNKCREVLER
ncbi:SpaA isopeptide-forming pilin-related protein [Coprococcus comes]|uniref:SpaA isopeptide-forming pilin-related protein n=1 Tax=Coprococcus comes TaxID=410072 RepID=UPI001C0265E8|nr:SpaA isopeptide-forming pilin-related protein [Coprococcus comes]MBT9782096.1 VWA domain-containing protein [Coprococcus comes]